MKPFDAKLLGVTDMPVHLQKIETGLAQLTATNNPALQEPISRLIRAGSKRLRSVLVIAVASSQGKPVDHTVISGCIAIELIHIGSLVHDDIIDKADTRWGIPTVSSKEGVNQAILVGDFLFAKANAAAASISTEAAELVASTIAALIDGESREVADEFNLDRTIESMTKAISGKTAALVSGACKLGGICAKTDHKTLAALAEYGESFGLAFQLVDDVLDFVSTEELMGKPVGNDVKEGVYTLSLLLALQGKHSKQVRNLLSQKPVDTAKLTDLLVKEGYVQRSVAEAKKYNQQAELALRGVSNTTKLAKLPQKYLNWAMSSLIDPRVTL